MNVVSRALPFAMLALVAGMMGAAHAANIKVDHQDCEGRKSKCAFITVDGDIRAGDENMLAMRTMGIEQAMVLLNSPGGRFEAGMDMARLIKKKGWDTGAAHCTSICAVMWLSGANRYYRATSRIGFHGVFWAATDRNGNLVTNRAFPSSGGNAVFGGYLAELGLSPKTIETLASPGPGQMYWLETKNLKELGITATRMND